jgi:hypothetical protein
MRQASKPVPEPEDPNSLIRQVLEMGEEFPGPAGDVLLSWLLDLKERVDPGVGRPAADRAPRPARALFADTLAGVKLICPPHETATRSPSGWKEWPDAGAGGPAGASGGISSAAFAQRD